MEPTHEGEIPGSLPPDVAFGLVGNETRIQILQTLGETHGPLSFTELRDRIGMHQGGQFNYHLDKIVGHFVGKSEAGYALRRPGSRVVQAILSGAVTEDPLIEPREINDVCYHCGARILLKYSEHLATYCPNCGGNFQLPGIDLAERMDTERFSEVNGLLSGYELPPAGIEGRSIPELLRAGTTWRNLEILSKAANLCPRCSASIETSVRVCEDHESTDGTCHECDARLQVRYIDQCSNCPYARRSSFSRHLLADTDFLNFLTSHGLNPVDPDSPMTLDAVLSTVEEEVRSVEPFEARFTFTIDNDAITLTVDDELEVTDVSRQQVASSPD